MSLNFLKTPRGENNNAAKPGRTRKGLLWRIASLTLLVLAVGPHGSAVAQEAPGGATQPPEAETVVLPPSVPDPLEPLNRVMWAFNKGLLTDIIKPTSKVYRFMVVKPIRTGIGNFGRNLTYPGRLINNLLQGKWRGARDETYRFLGNTTVGVAGFFDVATKWKIKKSDADFGQTFGQWGWKPNFFLMLPFLGPSNERDTVGFAADTAANPLLYISPYKFDGNNPLTYLGPYTYFTYAVMYNDLSDTVDESVRFSHAEPDPYSEIQYAWTFARENRVADFQVTGKQDKSAHETLESVFFTYQDRKFPDRAENWSVTIPATGRKLPFTYWLQKGKAPVVYIVPGLGSHRLAETSLALAELVYKKGFSVVCLSSPFNPEFMENASTADLPAYLPVDGQDLQVALDVIDFHLNLSYPNRMGEKALLGYSMGAIETAYVAAVAATNPLPSLKFDRYVALDMPVRMLQGVATLDKFYRAPLDWPAAERTNDLENTFLKVAALSKGTLTPQTSLPFNAIESKFLIGLSFRLVLRDIIYSSQRRHNQGVLHHAIFDFRRNPVYQEIQQYSYQDYFAKFAVPYYQGRGLSTPAAELEKAGDLRTYQAALSANPAIRVIVNQNDFLLTPDDLTWLRATFPTNQLTVFPEGGHLGNLSNPAVQRAILNALDGLQESPPIAPGHR
jgi:ABC-type transporter lipoprotein component MlaA/pimeloyl-ACP methyl ester carboxylesterase